MHEYAHAPTSADTQQPRLNTQANIHAYEETILYTQPWTCTWRSSVAVIGAGKRPSVSAAGANRMRRSNAERRPDVTVV